MRILFFLIVSLTFLTSCFKGDDAFLNQALRNLSSVDNSGAISSGDIVVLSGGYVDTSTTPYPQHKVFLYDSDGNYKTALHSEGISLIGGIAFNYNQTQILMAVDNPDVVRSIDVSNGSIDDNYFFDANMTGATSRAVLELSDRSLLFAESTTSIEKYDSSGTRVTTNFPITTSINTISNIRSISGNRFVVIFSGGTDYPRVYNNDGTYIESINPGFSCTTNCDPFDIVELDDGRFVISYQNDNYDSLELFNSSFAYVGQLYKNKTILANPTSMALTTGGDLLACNTDYHGCEKFTISGDTATRVGSTTFIQNFPVMRYPTHILVIP